MTRVEGENLESHKCHTGELGNAVLDMPRLLLQ